MTKFRYWGTAETIWDSQIRIGMPKCWHDVMEQKQMTSLQKHNPVWDNTNIDISEKLHRIQKQNPNWDSINYWIKTPSKYGLPE
jgi:hypothetical protein